MTAIGRVLVLGVALALLAGSCSHPTSSASHVADPAGSVAANPDYTQSCSPSGPDASVECAQVVLQSIDNARAKEHVGPMVLPSNFGKLSVAEQLFVALNRERVDRHLPAIAGLSDALTTVADRGASTGTLPPDPGSAYRNVDTEWIGAVADALDAVYQWMYQKGSAWADRHSVLDDFGSGGTLVLGASFNPSGDNDPTDKGGTSLAAVLAVTSTPGTLSYSWTRPRPILRPGRCGPGAGCPRTPRRPTLPTRRRRSPPTRTSPGPAHRRVWTARRGASSRRWRPSTTPGRPRA